MRKQVEGIELQGPDDPKPVLAATVRRQDDGWLVKATRAGINAHYPPEVFSDESRAAAIDEFIRFRELCREAADPAAVWID